MDVDNSLPWRVQNLPFVPIRLAGPRIQHEPKHVLLHRLGRKVTSDHEQPRSVRLVPMLFGGGVNPFRTAVQFRGQNHLEFDWFVPKTGLQYY